MTNIETLTPKNQENLSNQWGPPHYINRIPNSFHLSSLLAVGFNVFLQVPFYNVKAESINKNLKNEYNFSADDYEIASNLIIVRK